MAETTFDIMHVLRSDTLVISDTTYYDQYYIYRSVVDTLFISETEFRRENQRLQTTYQPGLVPPGPRKNPDLRTLSHEWQWQSTYCHCHSNN